MEVLSDFNPNLIDTNLDDISINAQWVELDKGILSENIGQQCEYIVKLSELFEKYPLPIFINSGFLRLAKVFQNGNNYLKFQVIRVIKMSSKHFQKIISVDEIAKLIFYNMHSNDCICRALTLRALAEIASIISEKHDIQHSIRVALESHDDIEAKQAIYAANKFCQVSSSFAEAVFERISEIIEDIQTPLDRKLRLIPLLTHMHHNPYLSSRAKNLCQAMFYSFPRPDISKIILNTLTKIACKSQTNIHDTICFFLKLLREEPREKLQLVLLENLDQLSVNVSHLWTFDNINEFLIYCDFQKANEKISRINSTILRNLAEKSNIYFFFLFNLSPHGTHNNAKCNIRQDSILLLKDIKEIDDSNRQMIKDLIESMIFHSDIDISINICFFSAILLIFQNENTKISRSISISDGYDDFQVSKSSKNDCSSSSESIFDKEKLFELTKLGIYSIILNCDKSINNSNGNASSDYYEKHLISALKCAMDLVKIRNGTYLDDLNDFLDNLLNFGNHRQAKHYCDTLLSLARFQFRSDRYRSKCEEEKLRERQKFIWNVFMKLNKPANQEFNHQINNDLQLKLINLLFELQVIVESSSSSRNDDAKISNDCPYVKMAINKFLETNHDQQPWMIYKLARMCARYAFFDKATDIYVQLANRMSQNMQTGSRSSNDTKDLNYKTWFDFMSILCRAESLIQQSSASNLSGFVVSLNESSALYLKALNLFKSICPSLVTQNSSSYTFCSTLTENSNTYFQSRFCELRSEQIRLYVHLIMSSLTYFNIPTPKHQFNSSDKIEKYGRIAQQLKYSSVELQKLVQKYKEFISECFDADNHSLNILNILRRQNECLIFVMNVLSSNKPEIFSKEFLTVFLNAKEQTESDDFFIESSAEMKIFESFLLKIDSKLNSLCELDKDNFLSLKRLQSFQDVLVDFISFPLPLPRSFFYSLQKTQIKLITTPNYKKINSVIKIKSDQTLVVKIEGIINQQFKNKEKPIRTIKKVQIYLNTEFDLKGLSVEAKAITGKYSDVKTSIEEPRNDYFSSSMLINFPYFGSYTIQVDLSIMDESNAIWRYMGEKQMLHVHVENSN